MKQWLVHLSNRALGAWIFMPFIFAVLFVANAPVARAAGVVGTGTAASCTDAALDAALVGGGLVTFDCGDRVTIDISTGTGTKTVDADTTIDGGGFITISGGNKVRVFTVDPGVEFTVRNLTIANGNVTLAGQAGGGILNVDGSVTVTNSTFTDNGDAISNGTNPLSGGHTTGIVTITNSTFSGNKSGSNGGAAIANGGILTVTDSTFTGNDGEPLQGIGPGGVIFDTGTLTVTSSTFTNNPGEAMVFASGTSAVANSTFTANTDAGLGAAGIQVLNLSDAAVTVTNSTFAGLDRAISNDSIGGGNASVLLRNTIVESLGVANCSGVVTDGGHNLDSGTSCGFSTANGSLSNTNPQLDPAGLRNNGGPTQTVALCTAAGMPEGCTAASPAVDAGDNSVCAAAPVNNLDQRGLVRPGHGHTHCSIGAYEAHAGGAVGTGTADSCTEAALDAALGCGVVNSDTLASDCTSGGSVTFNCGTSPVTIAVTSTKTIAADTTIDGGGMVTISGRNRLQVFMVNGSPPPMPPVAFALQNLTIANGNSVEGGAIMNRGTLTITNCTFSGNSASVIEAGGVGGAIFNDGRSTLTVTNCTFSGNHADDGGGAIVSGGTVNVTNSTFSGNSARGNSGGAILLIDGTLNVTNSTFSGNSAGDLDNGIMGFGGAIAIGTDILTGGTLAVTNSTFSGNNATGGGGAISNIGSCGNAPCSATVRNTIVAGSTGGNCYGAINDGGHNLDDHTSCGFGAANGSLSNTTPQVDPTGLRDNGGPTQTVALCSGVDTPAGCTAVSPAIDAGDDAVCAAAPVNNLDQRGIGRPGKGHAHCSIGAYEADGSPPELTAPFTKIITGDSVTTPAFHWNGAWGDYDDDGYLDLFVGASFASKRNYLYHNNRDGTFTLIDDAAMPKIPSNQHGAAWGDYDNDGHLDLIVTAGNPELTRNVIYRNNGDGTFTAITQGTIYNEQQLGGFHGPSWGDYDNDGFLDLFIAGHGIKNRLFHNNGDGTFTKILRTDPGAGVLVSDNSNSEGRTWVDYDNDGDIDLVVSNADSYPSALYRNDGRGVFTKVTDSGLTDRIENTFGSCWADYDNDGFLDLFLANAQENSLYHNNGDGTFSAVPDSAVVNDTISPDAIFSGCAWGDYDNDGFTDLFVTLGCFPNTPECLTPNEQNRLYHNNGDGTFTKVTQGSAVNDLVTACPGASWGDYDNDGFLDLFVSQGAITPDPRTDLLYHNDGNGNAWLNVKLAGTVSNRSAIGAKVRVKAFYSGASRWQLRQIFGGDSESNQSNALNAAFGLADANTVDTLRVEWPSGALQELHNVASRQFLTITEPYCAGDCDNNGLVTVDKLLTLVNIALGNAQRSACPHGVASSAAVDVTLIIQAVNNALGTCSGG